MIALRREPAIADAAYAEMDSDMRVIPLEYRCLVSYHAAMKPPSSSAPPENPPHYAGQTLVPEDTMAYVVRELYYSLRSAMDSEMAPLELTATQWRPLALLALGRADNPVELARCAGMDSGAMTRALDRLAAKGLLRRLRCEHDRRKVRLELTDEGRLQASRIPYAVAEAQNRHLRGISAHELDTFLGLARRMLAQGAAHG